MAGFKSGKWWLLALFAIGGACIASGFYKWHEARGPGQAVSALALALKAGDEAGARKLMAKADVTPLNPSPFANLPWDPSPNLTFRIHRLQVAGDFAIAEVWFSEFGYTVRPEITLERGADGLWKISQIDHLEADSRWIAAEKRQQVEDNELLAKELSTALHEYPAALVERNAPAPSETRRR